jgi:hypothetical protein
LPHSRWWFLAMPRYLPLSKPKTRYRFTLNSAFFVTRSKKNILLQRRYSHPVDKSAGVSSDQTVILASLESASAYPDPLRRVSYRDPATGKRLRLFTNNFTLPALTIAGIAISVYALVAIVRKRLTLDASLYQILQILSVIPFEKTPVFQALQTYNPQSDSNQFSNQLILFNL